MCLTAEVLVEFDTTITGADGLRWVPRASGGIADDGLWEGWIEFTPLSGSPHPIRTPRETEQPKRADLLSVLNPCAVYQQGENVLLQELSALSELRLRDIAAGYALVVASGVDGMNRQELVDMIVAGIRRPANQIERPRDATPQSDERA